MSQVVTIKVPAHFENACSEFRKFANITDTKTEDCTKCEDFSVFYEKTSNEIRCEGDFPDSVFFALVKVKERFGGQLLYEGEEWDKNDEDMLDESGPLKKTWIILAVVFFPVTLIYLLLRIVVWAPFKLWKATR